MPLDAPLRLGAFAATQSGLIRPADSALSPGFSLRWRDRTVNVLISQDPDDPACGIVRIEMILGRIPSTAGRRTGVDATDPNSARLQAFTTLTDLPCLLPDAWRLALLPDHRVALTSTIVRPMPLSTTALLTDITMFLLLLAPYLDAIDETRLAVDPQTEQLTA